MIAALLDGGAADPSRAERFDLLSPVVRGSAAEAARLGARLGSCPGVSGSVIEPSTGRVVVYFDPATVDRRAIREHLRLSRHLPSCDVEGAARRERTLDGLGRVVPLAARLLATALA